MNNIRDNSECNSFDNLKSQITTTLRCLWGRHAIWIRSYIINVSSGLKDLDKIKEKLLRNSLDIANELRVFYGDDKAKKFEEFFRQHILLILDLANNTRASNINEADINRRELYHNASGTAHFLSEINPHWDVRKWTIMLFDHLGMTEALIDSRLNGQYPADIITSDRIENQALAMADFMAAGILKHFNINAKNR